jgi:hypothetical protein
VTLGCSFANSVAYTAAACKDLANIASWGSFSVGGNTIWYNGSASCTVGAKVASISLSATIPASSGGACPAATTNSLAQFGQICQVIVASQDTDVAYLGSFTYTSVNGSCTNSSSSTCFPASASVQLQDGTTKTMAQLEVGDKVLVAPNTYSEVYFFAHRLTDALVAFVKIATSNGNTLMLTGDHYLYVNGKLATAKTVKVGDSLISADGSSIRVVEVSSEVSTGLYNPHTMQGDIVVDGVKTSTYTSSIAPSLAHAMLWPVRMLYSLGQNIVDGAFNEGSELISALLPSGKDAY